jgi:hypothetical protein
MHTLNGEAEPLVYQYRLDNPENPSFNSSKRETLLTSVWDVE